MSKEQTSDDIDKLSKPGSKPWATGISDPFTRANGMNFEGGPVQDKKRDDVCDPKFNGFGGVHPQFEGSIDRD